MFSDSVGIPLHLDYEDYQDSMSSYSEGEIEVNDITDDMKNNQLSGLIIQEGKLNLEHEL